MLYTHTRLLHSLQNVNLQQRDAKIRPPFGIGYHTGNKKTIYIYICISVTWSSWTLHAFWGQYILSKVQFEQASFDKGMELVGLAWSETRVDGFCSLAELALRSNWVYGSVFFNIIKYAKYNRCSSYCFAELCTRMGFMGQKSTWVLFLNQIIVKWLAKVSADSCHPIMGIVQFNTQPDPVLQLMLLMLLDSVKCQTMQILYLQINKSTSIKWLLFDEH